MSILRGRNWPGTKEPLFTDSDYDYLIEYDAERRKACPNCGLLDAEFRDERGREIQPPPFVPDAFRCVPCGMMEEFQEDLQKSRARKGTRVFMRPFDPKLDDPEPALPDVDEMYAPPEDASPQR